MYELTYTEDRRIIGCARTIKEWEKESNFDNVELVPADRLIWHEEGFEISLATNGDFVFYSDDGVPNASNTLQGAREDAKQLRARVKKGAPKRKLDLPVIGLNSSNSSGKVIYGITDATITGLHMGNGEFTGFSKDINKNGYRPMPRHPDTRTILEIAVTLRKKLNLVEKAIKELALPTALEFRALTLENYEENISRVEVSFDKRLAGVPLTIKHLKEDLAQIDIDKALDDQETS